jgi:hypothetical protein
MNAFSGEPDRRELPVECAAALDHKWGRENPVAKITI